MSLIQHHFFPRSLFNMNQWMSPLDASGFSTLDLFDAFDELDHMMMRNMHWLNKPEFFHPLTPTMLPIVPQKYRIVVDCPGFSASSIKTELKGNKLVVSGREEDKYADDDYHTKEFRRSYHLPERCESEKLVSFMAAPGKLVIEIPMKETAAHMNMDLFPKVVDTENGKAVTLDFSLPDHVTPDKIQVQIKDRDLIVKAEDNVESKDSMSKFYYYKRTTLPDNTDFDKLECNFDNHKLAVKAPLNSNINSYKSIPIGVQKQPQIKN